MGPNQVAVEDHRATIDRLLGQAELGDRGGSSGKEVTVTEHTPYIDFDNLPAPSEGFLVTLFITVRSVARSRAFYSEVLGGQVVLEENPCMVKLSNSWVIMNPGGPPTPDKPDISVVDSSSTTRSRPS